MGRIPREKQKVLAVIFLASGAWGIGIGYMMPNIGDTSFYVTLLGVINLSLGGIVGYYYLTRIPVKSRKRKK